MNLGVLCIASGFFYLISLSLFNNNTKKQLDKEYDYEEIYIEENKDMIVVEAPPCNTCVYIEESQQVNKQNNIIYNVNLIKEGNIVTTLNSVSGREWTQGLDRNISGNESPSPSGEYTILSETVGYHPETGGVFLPYEPRFKTERSFLGFHVDPSWGLSNGEDGTKGCHAFKNREEYNTLVRFIETNLVTQLIIN